MTQTNLELMARMRGITVEELRQKYSEMGKKSPRSGGIKSSEQARELARKSHEARRKNNELKKATEEQQ